MTIAAAAVLALVGGLLNDRLGRRPVIMVASMIFTVGSLIMGFAKDKYVLLVGRVVVGAGIGECMAVCAAGLFLLLLLLLLPLHDVVLVLRAGARLRFPPPQFCCCFGAITTNTSLSVCLQLSAFLSARVCDCPSPQSLHLSVSLSVFVIVRVPSLFICLSARVCSVRPPCLFIVLCV